MSIRAVRLHVRQDVTATTFTLMPSGVPVEDSRAALAVVTYPVIGVLRDFVVAVAEEMDVTLTGMFHQLSPGAYIDHVAYQGWMETDDNH